jgi:hypothetical protein
MFDPLWPRPGSPPSSWPGLISLVNSRTASRIAIGNGSHEQMFGAKEQAPNAAKATKEQDRQ